MVPTRQVLHLPSVSMQDTTVLVVFSMGLIKDDPCDR